MDHPLRCNNLSCRKQAADRAFVTSCAHVICLECAHNIGFNDQNVPGRQRVCPICKIELQTPEDVKIRTLHMSEGYKTTVLGGLSPETIMECAGRAINFWSYQAIQEAYYQDHLYTTLKDKYSSLNMSAERISSEAKAQIEALEKKLSATIAENEMYRQKNDELTNAYREKHRQLQQVQQLYDKAKRTAELGQLQQAASDEVNHTVQEAGQLASKAFGRSFQERDPDSFPTILRFGAAQNGHAGGSSLNQGAPQSGPAHGGESSRWSKPAVPSRGDMSATPRSGNGRPRVGLGMSTNFQGFDGQDINRGATGSTVPMFANNRPGFSNAGLTSGLRVSFPPREPRLDTSLRRF